MLPTDVSHLSSTVRHDLRRATAIVFEAFAELVAGKTAMRYRTGHIDKLILHGDHVAPALDAGVVGVVIRLMAIVNDPKLASCRSDWAMVHDRLRQETTFGRIAHPVSLTVHSLQEVNSALVDGVPHFVTVATNGIALYEADGSRLSSPRRLSPHEHRARGLAEFERWHGRAIDFLAGAEFYHDRGSTTMAALLLHQTCEHLYQCVAWALALHGRRSHSLDELRDVAEQLEPRLAAAWPRAARVERHAFGCIRRAYVEARYGRDFTVAPAALSWAMERVVILDRIVTAVCEERLGCGNPVYGVQAADDRGQRAG